MEGEDSRLKIAALQVYGLLVDSAPPQFNRQIRILLQKSVLTDTLCNAQPKVFLLLVFSTSCEKSASIYISIKKQDPTPHIWSPAIFATKACRTRETHLNCDTFYFPQSQLPWTNFANSVFFKFLAWIVTISLIWFWIGNNKLQNKTPLPYKEYDDNSFKCM